MSSILKALKKLEDDTTIKRAGLRPYKIYQKKPVPRRMKSRLLSHKLHLVVLTGIVVAFGGGLIFKLKPWEKAPEPVVVTETTPINLPDKNILVPEVTQKQASARKIAKQPETVMKPVKTPSIQTKPKETASIPDLPMKETSTGIEAKNPEQKKVAERLISIPVKQTSETGLELQAIAWATDRESRIAVINGNVVREGESIDRAMVVQIGKNVVAFKKDGEEWQQLFRKQ